MPLELLGWGIDRVAWVALGGLGFLLLRLLLRPRPRRVVVAWLGPWKLALKGRMRRRTRELLALFCQVLAVLALALAMGQAGCPNEPESPEILAEDVVLDRVFVVDVSLSMGARDGGQEGTRLERVRGTLRALSGDLRQGERLALIEAGATPRLLVPLTALGDRFRVGLADLQVRPGGSALEDALLLAQSLPLAKHGRVELFTDDPRADDLELGARGVVHAVGSAQENLSIEAFGVTRSEGLPARYEAYVRVVSHGFESKTVSIALETKDAVLGQERVTLQPELPLERIYRFGPRSDAMVELHLQALNAQADALPTDDVAYAVLPPLTVPRVVVVTPGNRYLEAALSTIKGLRLKVLLPSSFAPAKVRGADLVIYDGVAPSDAPQQPSLFVHAGGAVDEVDHPLLTSWNLGHAILQGVEMSGLLVRSAEVYAPRAEDVPLVQGPAGVHCLIRDGNTVLWGFDFADSDLPLRLAFPRLIYNLVAWSRTSLPERDRTLDAADPLWMEGKVVLEHGEARSAWDTGDGRWPLTPTAPGAWSLEPQDSEASRPGAFAVRWLGDNEGDLLRLPLDRGSVGIRPEAAREAPPHPLWWPWLLALAAGLSLLEGRLEAR